MGYVPLHTSLPALEVSPEVSHSVAVLKVY